MRRPFEALAAGRSVACVDIGGTKVSVTIASREGPVAHLAEPTATAGTNDAVAAQVLRMIGIGAARAGVSEDRIDAVGVAAAGPFVRRDGHVELASPNLCGALAGRGRGLPNDWHTALLEGPLRARFRDVRVANDCVAALIAERRWGALQGIDHCAYVTWSTGIGTGLCVDGHVLQGRNGNAGHAGHTFVNDDPAASLCGCGNFGDVEAQVSGSAIERRLGVEAATVLAAARAGEARASTLVDDACRILGRALYNLVATLDIERISLGGGVFWHNREFLLPRLSAQFVSRPQALVAGATLVPAGLGLQVVDFGALALVA
jgi:glucokinase